MIKVHLDGRIYGLAPHAGIARLFTHTTRQLLRDHADLRVLLSLPAGTIPVPRFPPPLRTLRLGRFAGLLRPVLAAWRPDIYHPTFYTHSPEPRAKSVVTVYDFVDRRLPALIPCGPAFVERQRRVIEGADMLIAISATTRDDIARFTGADPDRVVVAYPAVAEAFTADVDRAAEGEEFRRRFAGGRPYWLYVGDRRGYKNFDVLLRAFCGLARKADAHLVLAGSQQRLEDYEQELVVRSSCEDRITHCHRPDDLLLRAAYAGAAALVQTSLWEGFGIPLVEAAACGTALVLSDIAVFREVAGDAALYADPHDPGSWTVPLEATLSAPTHRRLGAAANAAVAGRFTWKQAADQVYAAYERALGR